MLPVDVLLFISCGSGGLKLIFFKLPSSKRLRCCCIRLHDTGVICADSMLLSVAFGDPEIRYRSLNLT
jgi:hypothetical protein